MICQRAWFYISSSCGCKLVQLVSCRELLPMTCVKSCLHHFKIYYLNKLGGGLFLSFKRKKNIIQLDFPGRVYWKIPTPSSSYITCNVSTTKYIGELCGLWSCELIQFKHYKIYRSYKSSQLCQKGNELIVNLPRA